MKYRAAVVGLGRIGQEYDYDAPLDVDGSILTHARAFALHPGFELVAGVDPSATQRDRFSAKYGRPAYPTQAAMLAAEHPEIVAVCSPTAGRTTLLREAIASRPKAVIAEKPLAMDVASGRDIVDSARRQDCMLLVNFIRRFEPGANRLRAMVARGELGAIFKAVAWYSNGLRNNASHLVDLLRFILGESRSSRVLRRGGQTGDGDVEPDFAVEIGSTPAYILAAKEQCYSLFEFQLLGEKGRALYASGGSRIHIERAGEDPLFPGFRALENEPARIESEMQRYQWHVVDSLHRCLATGEPPASDGNSALGTLEVIASIERQCKEPA
jgi:predicted dehydrogenase